MTLTKDQELWAVALWVEKHHGDEGDLYIAQQLDRLLVEGDLDGMAMWRKVRKRVRGAQGSVAEIAHGA